MTGTERMPTEIRACEESQRPAVLALLADCGLPAAGLADHWSTTWVALDPEGASAILGSVALEIHGSAALLRSLATHKDHRGHGLGDALYRFAIARAHELGATSVSLLTTTAEPFFAAREFHTVSRDALPTALKASAEFQGACPASATAMLRSLF